MTAQNEAKPLLETIRRALPNSTTRDEIVAAWKALDALTEMSRAEGVASPDGLTETREVAWLIERGQPEGSPVTYWLCDDERIRDTANPDDLCWVSGYAWGWTSNASLARKFPSQNAANAYVANKHVNLCHVTEHVFFCAPAASPAESAGTPCPTCEAAGEVASKHDRNHRQRKAEVWQKIVARSATFDDGGELCGLVHVYTACCNFQSKALLFAERDAALAQLTEARSRIAELEATIGNICRANDELSAIATNFNERVMAEARQQADYKAREYEEWEQLQTRITQLEVAHALAVKEIEAIKALFREYLTSAPVVLGGRGYNEQVAQQMNREERLLKWATSSPAVSSLEASK